MIRSECRGGPRPCPCVGCCHNLLIVSATRDPRQRANKNELTFNPAARKITRDLGVRIEDDPAAVLEAMPETCALDVAEKGEHTFIEVGDLLGMTREAPRQLFERMIVRMKRAPKTWALLRDLMSQARERDAGRTECAIVSAPRVRHQKHENRAAIPFLRRTFKHKRGRPLCAG